MLIYRVFPYSSRAQAGEPGHPTYLHRPQGRGRFDNPDHYDIWYLAATPAGAIGETFADISAWTESMFIYPGLHDGRRTVGVYSIAEGTSLLDLDDARNLLDRNLRPTQVVDRNRTATQQLALRVFREQHHGKPAWDGVRWWSYHHPQWPILGLWRGTPTVEHLEPISLGHAWVRDAARVLARQLPAAP